MPEGCRKVVTWPSRNLNICMQSHIDLTLHGDVRKICTRSTRPPPRPSWPQWQILTGDLLAVAKLRLRMLYMTAFHTPSCHAQVMVLDHSFSSRIISTSAAPPGSSWSLRGPHAAYGIRRRTCTHNQNVSSSQLSAKRSACINHRPVRPPVRGHCALTNVHSVSVHSMSSLCPATN